MRNFNSIKVQLELAGAGSMLGGLLFQFHKGTIRTLFADVSSIIIIYFNSIKVQLELEAAGLNPYLMLEFQFHKGTIRTYLCSWFDWFLSISIP